MLILLQDGIESCELYPFPIPDLFLGSPITIAGKFVALNQFPKKVQHQFPPPPPFAAIHFSLYVRVCFVWFLFQVTLTGTYLNGKTISLSLHTTENAAIPVSKVFLRQRLDVMTARAWLLESKEMEREIATLAVDEGMPSAFTTMVSYEVDPNQHHKLSKKGKSTKNMHSHTCLLHCHWFVLCHFLFTRRVIFLSFQCLVPLLVYRRWRWAVRWWWALRWWRLAAWVRRWPTRRLADFPVPCRRLALTAVVWRHVAVRAPPAAARVAVMVVLDAAVILW
jgi:hypothetical protein